jgi:hypothetical protein
MRAVFLLALLSGCGAPALTIANGVGLGVQTAALACDWSSTRSVAERGWVDAQGRGQHESNPAIQAMGGRKPAPNVIDGYFLGVVALSAIGWYVMPRRYRFVVPLLVTAIEAKAVYNNVVHRTGVCGLQ